MACVDLHALPLQVLLRRRAEWRDQPAAVVDCDKPQGQILWVNKAARASHIQPGLRYSAALSRNLELRASVVDDEEIASTVASVTERLWHFSPRVEPSPSTPGVFWLDAAGIVPLYPTLEEWARRIRDDLWAAGFRASVAVGFTRFASYAAARVAQTRGGTTVFESPRQEYAHSRGVLIDRLGFAPRLRDTLGELGIVRLGQFLDLPAAGVRRRFGAAAADLHRRARGDTTVLDPAPPTELLVRTVILDRPEANLERLMVVIEELLTPLCEALRRRHEALGAVCLRLTTDDKRSVDETLEPAEATLDQSLLESLIRLRLATVSLFAGVTEVEVEVRGGAIENRQLDLFTKPPRDLTAARRALARIRAEFGNAAVVRASLQDGHLPEARFVWGPFERLELPCPRQVDERPLVRRFFPCAVELPLRSRHEPDGWMINLADGPIEEVVGPHIVQGGWWMRDVERHYYYVRSRSGRWLWIYNDRRRRLWFMQGEVE